MANDNKGRNPKVWPPRENGPEPKPNRACTFHFSTPRHVSLNSAYTLILKAYNYKSRIRATCHGYRLKRRWA